MPYALEFDPKRWPSDAALAHARHSREAGLRQYWIKPWDPNRGLNDEQLKRHAAWLREMKATLDKITGETITVDPKKPKWVDEKGETTFQESDEPKHLLKKAEDTPESS